MAHEPDNSPFDSYIVARMALWAGDFDFFQNAIRKIAPRADFGKMPNRIHGPDEAIRYCAALRSRQLSQKRSEFAKLAGATAVDQLKLSPQPEIIETKHLRGAVWRRGARRFVLRAFLFDLDWETGLFSIATSLVQKYHGYYSAPGEGESSRLSFSWFKPGRFAIEIVIGNLGLIEAEGVWTEAQDLLTIREVLTTFGDLLSEIDPGQEPSSRTRDGVIP